MQSTSRYPVVFRLLAATAFAVAATTARPADNLREFITQGTPGLDLRWRLENVDQDPFAREATAIPLRARINFASGTWRGWSAFVEYDHVFDLGADGYNEGAGNTPDRSAWPVIADPSGGDLNQAYMQYDSRNNIRFRTGRQRIIYDNARFIGNVGWRQNEQTYDALSLESTAWGGFEVRGAYIWQVNRIFGDDVPEGRHDMQSALINVARSFGENHRLAGYVYRIDDDDTAAFSTLTAGLRLTGHRPTEPGTIEYTLEMARQEDAADNPQSYDADYLRGELAVAFAAVTPYVGYESLGGDERPGKAFRTPLATLHAFNGWADKFLVTPDTGLVDLFGGLRGKAGAWSWNVLYHDFSAESGSTDFGDEIDASLSRTLAGNVGLLLKAARFRSDDPSFGDTTKFWVQLTASFKGSGS